MTEYLYNGKVVLYDKERDSAVKDEDGFEIIFSNRISALPHLFSLQYTEAFALQNFLVLPVNTSLDLN